MNDAISSEEDIENLIDDTDLTKRLTYIQRCKNELRYRWLDEYLHALQERQKMRMGGTEYLPGVGAIVLLKEDIKDKAQWKIARITKELRGSDKQLRGYELKLGNGYTIQRPIQLVCPLELQTDVQVEDDKPEEVDPIDNNDRPKRLAKDTAKAKISIMSEKEDDLILN